MLLLSLQNNFPLQQKFGCQKILFLLITLLGLPAGSVVKNLPASAGDTRDAGSVSGLGRSPGVGNDDPLQYSCLENSMDRGAGRATVHGIPKSRTWLSN